MNDILSNSGQPTDTTEDSSIAASKSNRLPFVLIGILILLLVTFGGYYVGLKSHKEFISSALPTITPTESSETPRITQTPTITTVKDSFTFGKFKINFSYPAEGIPVVRLCFESTKDLSKQYCFLKVPGIASSLKQTDVSSIFTDEGELPAGDYYAYIVVYWNDSPADIFNMNECNYKGSDRGSHPERKIYCAEVDKQIESRQQKSPDGIWISSIEKNVHFGGKREIFKIQIDKLLNLGTVSVSL